MRKTFILALMAAAAIVPAMASAQDRGDGRPHRGGEPSANRPQGNNGGGRNRGAAPAAAPAPAPAPAPQPNNGGWRGRGGGAPAPQADNGGWRGRDRAPADTLPQNNGWRGRGGDGLAPAAPAPQGNDGSRFRGGWGGRTEGGVTVNRGGDDQARAQAEARARADRNRWNGNGGPDNGQGYRNWQGRNGGVNSGGDDQARAQAEARARADRDRSNGSNDRWRNGRGNGGGWNGNNGNGVNRWRGNDGNRGGAWNRGWRGSNQYDWQRYRTSNRNLFRLPRYYAPYGWSYGYRRFSIGLRLESILFRQDYWIDDPYEYRLPEAYGEYRWVRYYNDALLVDIDTGEVVDVVYDIFY